MSRITLTAEMKALLSGASGRVELCDEAGNPFGYFEPKPTEVAPKGGWGPFTAEEVEEAFNQTGPTKTLDEIIKQAGLS